MKIALFVLVFLLCGCSLKSQQITFAGVQAGDLASTHYAESRGLTEQNRVMQVNWPTRIVLKGAGVITVVYVTSKLAHLGHKAFAKGLLAAVNAAMVGVITRNYWVAKGTR